MALKWEKVKLPHPLRKPMKGGSKDSIELTVIEASELPESVKEKRRSISWSLYTTP
jgi:hypothetical protein